MITSGGNVKLAIITVFTSVGAMLDWNSDGDDEWGTMVDITVTSGGQWWTLPYRAIGPARAQT